MEKYCSVPVMIAYAASRAGVASVMSESLVSAALSKITETSMPMRAAGTKPKAPRTLNLPPTLGLAFTTVSPASREAKSKGEFGSVTIIM